MKLSNELISVAIVMVVEFGWLVAFFNITKIRAMIVMSLKISIVYDDDVSSFFDGFDALIRTTKNSNMRVIQQENSSMNGIWSGIG